MENRKFTRVEFETEAEVIGEKITIKGKVENLSIRGMFIRTDKKMDINSIVDIIIHLSGSTTELTINLKGIILRSDNDGIAIEFKEMELDSFIHLRNLVFYADRELHEFYELL